MFQFQRVVLDSNCLREGNELE